MTTPDTLDEKIRLLVAELVDSAPLAPPVPDRDAQRQWRERRRRQRALRSTVAAVAAVAVAVAAVLAVVGPTAPAPGWALVSQVKLPWQEATGYSGGFAVSLTCPSAITCYVEGSPTVEVTRDGGKVWQPTAVWTPRSPTLGGMPISNVACSTTRACAFLEGVINPLFVETANAGRTWTSRPGPAGLSSIYQLNGAQQFIGPVELSCPSASACVVVATSPFGRRGGAFLTKDRGRTWSASSLSSIPAQVQCFPGSRCVSTGVVGARPGSRPHFGASYSTDNGLVWSPAGVPPDVGGSFALSCSNSENCLASLAGRAQATLIVSHNGGESWSVLDPRGLPAGKVFTALACPTTTACWISGDAAIKRGQGRADGYTGGVVLSSADGGRIWQSTGLPKGVSGIVALSCPTVSRCFALATTGPAGWLSGQSAPPSVLLLAYTAASQ
jgi:hypothetical protein